MLTHHVERMSEYFESIHRAPSIPWIKCCVSRFTFEFHNRIHNSLTTARIGFYVRARMPCQCDIQILKESFTSHVNFPADRFFRRSPIEPYGPLELSCCDEFLDRYRRSETCDSKQVMTAAVSGSSGLERFLYGGRLLRDAGQCIIFAQYSDDRTAFSVGGDESGRHSCNAPFDFKAFLLGVVC